MKISIVTLALFCVIFIFVLWLFYGGRKHSPQGLATIINTLKQEPINESKIANIISDTSPPPERHQEKTLENSRENAPINEHRKDDHVSEEKISRPVPQLPPDFVPQNINTHLHGSKEEMYACQAAAKVFGVPFQASYKPDWMKNPNSGINLELDCYNDDLKIAIEYNGIHHYEYPNWTTKKFKATKEQFAKQVQRDLLKPELCDEQGVWLITIPYTVKRDDYERYIEYYSPYRVAEREGHNMAEYEN